MMPLIATLLSLCLSLVALSSTAQPAAGGNTSYLGGLDQRGFQHPSANLSLEARLNFRIGESLFQKLWVASPSSTTASDGLGPLFNARSCHGCHLQGGRGKAVNTEHPFGPGSLIRLSQPADASILAAMQAGLQVNQADPLYGHQLQPRALPGLTPEAELNIHYQEQIVELADGSQVSLRQPKVLLTWLQGQPASPPHTSLRIAPGMQGLGLLEAIASEDILALADPDDRNGDGISGRPNWVWSRAHQQTLLGRFGWKAGQASLLDQNAAALNGDLGLSNPLYPNPAGDCSPQQQTCLEQPHGNTAAQDNLEVSSVQAELLRFYTRHLAPLAASAPQDREQRQAGEQVFHQLGCQQCHRPQWQTSSTPTLLSDDPALLQQTIYPYTDLLLHDMGPGLADPHQEYQALGQEWRTPPLWGLGAALRLTPQTGLLHDGRARTMAEAILWHDGEARQAQQAYRHLSSAQRQALHLFLESL
ncbi:di-heme oxidoreductase family protein [Balneatrix alpica]|uniref:di-heme oxidoreductase family protein n=1 Tax=Balneatrix alpica TaxID=75684 RepID=UPI002739AB29|nr:di-heme oxidoredictase family protein [Balneatrix alpica]